MHQVDSTAFGGHRRQLIEQLTCVTSIGTQKHESLDLPSIAPVRGAQKQYTVLPGF